MNVFGPVPSRRLGRSLGINNIPPKICSYACVYCQLGRTLKMQLNRMEFYKFNDIIKEVLNKVAEAKTKKEPIDYLSFVPDGEPTLDANLGKEIDMLKFLGIKIAVISNASLIANSSVRDDLAKADWVSLKVDAVSEEHWRQIDRPHGALKLKDILKGISTFSSMFKGTLVTETMLIKDVNDNQNEIKKIASYLMDINPSIAYIAIPTRPPAEKWVKPAREYSINNAYQMFTEKLDNVEYLLGYEGNAFAFTNNAEDDLLSITSVHPMREDAINEFLLKSNTDAYLIKRLIIEGKLVETEYNGKKFYTRKLSMRN